MTVMNLKLIGQLVSYIRFFNIYACMLRETSKGSQKYELESISSWY
jgi:hypothetical protein